MCCEMATVLPPRTPFAAVRSASDSVTVLLATPSSPLAPLRLALRPVPVGSTGAQAPATAVALGAAVTAGAADGAAVAPPAWLGAVVHPTATVMATNATPRWRSD